MLHRSSRGARACVCSGCASQGTHQGCRVAASPLQAALFGGPAALRDRQRHNCHERGNAHKRKAHRTHHGPPNCWARTHTAGLIKSGKPGPAKFPGRFADGISTATSPQVRQKMPVTRLRSNFSLFPGLGPGPTKRACHTPWRFAHHALVLCRTASCPACTSPKRFLAE